jgi:predicted TIM-barrel fold metal-dependent hydrolase
LALATAFNEFFLAKFLAIDDRYKLAMVVAAHDPVASAAEIRRLGPLPGGVAVFLPLLNIMMGNRHYYPFYEAAEELGLPILIHSTGTEGGFPTSVAFAGGTPSTYIERHTDFPQIGMCAITSLVFEGVFARFPRLMVLAAEFGFTTGLLFKDVRLCLDAAEALGVPTPVGAAIRQALDVTNALYGGDSDFTSVVKPIGAWAGVEVRSK